MSTLSGGFAKTGGPIHTRPGVPCTHCGNEVNVAPFGRAREVAPKTRAVEQGEPKRRPNPRRRTLIYRVVCSTCHNKGLE